MSFNLGKYSSREYCLLLFAPPTASSLKTTISTQGNLATTSLVFLSTRLKLSVLSRLIWTAAIEKGFIIMTLSQS